MALFSRKKASEDKVVTANPTKKEVASVKKIVGRDLGSVLIKPRISEKAVKGNDQNVYTFVIHKDATKYDVRDAIKEIFKVTPVRVNIVNKRPKQSMSRSRGRVIRQAGIKKAYVYLKKGETINLV